MGYAFQSAGSALPVTGVCLKSRHYAEAAQGIAAGRFLEVHSENYMGDGGPPHRALERIRQDHPLSFHGVALSLGTADGIDTDHLARLARLVRRYQPAMVSEHLSWSGISGAYLNDLLPLPYTQEALDIVATNVERVQSALGRPILVENPSTYLTFDQDEMSEAAFIAALCRRTGCGLLLDVNNVVVCAANHRFDPIGYLDDLAGVPVGEIHLAGHAIRDVDGVELRLDDHGSAVPEDVWRLYGAALERFGAVPSLVEWDTDTPALPVLLAEADTAQAAQARLATAERADDAA